MSFGSNEIKFGVLNSRSESTDVLLIIWVGLNSNYVRLMKSSAFELGITSQSPFMDPMMDWKAENRALSAHAYFSHIGRDHVCI